MLNETDKVIVRMAAHIAALEGAIPQLQEQIKSAQDEAKALQKQLTESQQKVEYLGDMLKAAAVEKANENHV